tara:strand:+ start:34 stop:1602 length:1569 start_codon:yes stop_codon:yes gene_type:complete
MAVPSTGSLSLLKCWCEKNEDDYTADNQDGETTFSLRGLSHNSYNDSTGGNINLNAECPAKPDQAEAHKMSEFYNYDHDYVTGAPCNKAMDIVFLLDYTSSMTDDFSNATYGIKNIIGTITDKIVARSGGDYRIGLVLIDQMDSSNQTPSYWAHGTVAAGLDSQYKYSSGDIRLTSLIQMSGGNKSTVHSYVGMLDSGGTNNSTNMSIGTGSGGPEPNDTAIDRVMNHDFAGAFRSGVNRMIVLLTDNAPDGDGDDSFDGTEEYDKMGTLTTTALAEKIVISVCGTITDGGTYPKNIHGIYQSYADNTGGSFDSSSDPSDILTYLDNICNSIENNFPDVTTNADTNHTTSSFKMNGNVTDQGGSSVTARGFVRKQGTNANDLYIGGTGVTNHTSGSGTGSFNVTATGLSSGTIYHYKAYATNSTGTSYGAAEAATTTSVSYTTRYVDGPHQKHIFACFQTPTDVIKYTGTFGNGTTIYDNNLNLITASGWYNGPVTTSGSSSDAVFYVNGSGVVSSFQVGFC